MPQRFLIDGYNLLHALGLPKRLGVGGLQRACQELVAFVRRRCPEAECIVVFDGTQASGRQDDNGVAVLRGWRIRRGTFDSLIGIENGVKCVDSGNACQDPVGRGQLL